jgi:hypothetical protein
VSRVARNFDDEYLRPDDPFIHGRSFTVLDAEADLILRLIRDRWGNESIVIIAVDYLHTGREVGNDEDR